MRIICSTQAALSLPPAPHFNARASRVPVAFWLVLPSQTIPAKC